MADGYERAVLLFFAIAVCLAVAWVMRRAILLIWVSILVAILLTPIVEWIHRWRIRSWGPSRGASVLILAGILLGVIAGFSLLFLPPLLHDTKQLEQ